MPGAPHGPEPDASVALQTDGFRGACGGELPAGRVRWVDDQLRRPGVTAAGPPWSVLQLGHDPAIQAHAAPTDVRQHLDALGVAWVVVEATQRTAAMRPLLRLRLFLQEQAELVARFRASAPGRRFLDDQDTPQALARSLAAERLGPAMEVYRLSPVR